MGGDEVELRVSEVHTNARPRALRKGVEFAFHLPRIGGRIEPALGLKFLGIFEGVRVQKVDVAAGRDVGLEKSL